MRAASWLREGRRAAEEDFEWSGPGCEAADGFALIARSMAWSIVMAAAHKSQPQRAPVLFLSQKIDSFLRTLPMYPSTTLHNVDDRSISH